MKQWRGHVVPLSPRVKSILKRLKKLAGDSPYLFPAGPQAWARETLHKDAFGNALNAMGYKGRQSPHGARGLLKTAASESGLWRSEVVEMQLAHARGALEDAYNDALYLPERRELMAWWSDRFDTMLRAEKDKRRAIEVDVADLIG